MTAAMEFANDLLAGLRSRVHSVPHGGAAPGIDWFGLHSRFAAGHAARRELDLNESHRPVPAGGFAMWRGFAASPGKSLPGVNLTDSADSKILVGIEGAVAGEPGTGGRGQE
jgi:hypothetical protein